MAGESRGDLLKRVRTALGHSGGEPPPPPAVEERLVRLATRDDDLPALFAERAREVGMHVHRAEESELGRVLREVLDAVGARSAAVSSSRDLGEVLCAAGCEIVPADPERLYEVDVGITDAPSGLAETGTLVLHGGENGGRTMSLVPPVHVALLSVRDLLPDMLDYWALPRPPASSRVFITGPSKTADIEGELIEGVHGPGAVHVILIAD